MRVWTRQYQPDGTRKWVAVTGNQAIIAWLQDMLLLQKGECPSNPDLGFSPSQDHEDFFSCHALIGIERQVSQFVPFISIKRDRKSPPDQPAYNIHIIFSDGTSWSSRDSRFNQSYSQTGPYEN